MSALQFQKNYVAGLPHLDVFTVSEDWLLATALEHHWIILSGLVGLKPSQWIDTQGDRMYAAVVYLATTFNLDGPVLEDDEMGFSTTVEAIQKPHALSMSRITVGGVERATVTMLTSFIKRNIRGSNKKFSRVRDLWKSDDFSAEKIERFNESHHTHKSTTLSPSFEDTYRINRIQDFNTADFMYFKNFVRIAKAAEWRSLKTDTRFLNSKRECFFYGNVEDGDVISTIVQRTDDMVLSEHINQSGKRIFLSNSSVQEVSIPVR